MPTCTTLGDISPIIKCYYNLHVIIATVIKRFLTVIMILLKF